MRSSQDGLIFDDGRHVYRFIAGPCNDAVGCSKRRTRRRIVLSLALDD
jgi:hypothetical protein